MFWSNGGGWKGEGKISGALALPLACACSERNGGLDADAAADADTVPVADANAMAMTLPDVPVPTPVAIPVSAPVAASVGRTREPFFSFSLILFPAAMEVEVVIRSVRLDPSAPSVSGLLPYTGLETEIETEPETEPEPEPGIDLCTALLYVAIEFVFVGWQMADVSKQRGCEMKQRKYHSE